MVNAAPAPVNAIISKPDPKAEPVEENPITAFFIHLRNHIDTHMRRTHTRDNNAQETIVVSYAVDRELEYLLINKPIWVEFRHPDEPTLYIEVYTWGRESKPETIELARWLLDIVEQKDKPKETPIIYKDGNRLNCCYVNIAYEEPRAMKARKKHHAA